MTKSNGVCGTDACRAAVNAKLSPPFVETVRQLRNLLVDQTCHAHHGEDRSGHRICQSIPSARMSEILVMLIDSYGEVRPLHPHQEMRLLAEFAQLARAGHHDEEEMQLPEEPRYRQEH